MKSDRVVKRVLNFISEIHICVYDGIYSLTARIYPLAAISYAKNSRRHFFIANIQDVFFFAARHSPLSPTFLPLFLLWMVVSQSVFVGDNSARYIRYIRDVCASYITGADLLYIGVSASKKHRASKKAQRRETMPLFPNAGIAKNKTISSKRLKNTTVR